MSTADTTIASTLPVILADAYRALPGVTAIVLAGSSQSGGTDGRSDLDLYIYAESPPPLAGRAAIAHRFAAEQTELDTRFWEPGDSWIHPLTGLAVDVMYRSPAWLESELERVLVRHEARVGYSTCFWHNVLHSAVLFDRDGWYGQTRNRADVPYPVALQRAIVAHNLPLLGTSRSSFRHQIAAALARQDWLSVQHRLTAFLASYFDILFAIHRLPHPGEKRMLETLQRHGTPGLLPPNLAERLDLVIGAGPSPRLLDHLDRLTADLEQLVERALPPDDIVTSVALAPDRLSAEAWHEWEPWAPTPAPMATGSAAAR